VKLLVEVSQLAITLIVSGVVAFFVGAQVYIPIASLVLMTCMALLFDAGKRHSEATEDPIGLLTAMQIAGTSVVFGIIWPAIPLIFTWRRAGLLDEVR
jgi:hypothetical protein